MVAVAGTELVAGASTLVAAIALAATARAFAGHDGIRWHRLCDVAGCRGGRMVLVVANGIRPRLRCRLRRGDMDGDHARGHVAGAR